MISASTLLARPTLPTIQAQGSSVVWLGMNTPATIIRKMTFEPRKRHLEST